MVLSDFGIGILWYFQISVVVLFGILWYFQIFVLVLFGILWYFPDFGSGTIWYFVVLTYFGSFLYFMLLSDF